MGVIVIDASVAAKWILTEADSAIAMEWLKSDARLAAPSIIQVEVAGAVLRRMSAEEMSGSAARAACDEWSDLIADGCLELVPWEGLYVAAVELSFEIRHPLPDCLYLVLAREWDATLVTADKAFHQSALKLHDRSRLLAQAA